MLSQTRANIERDQFDENYYKDDSLQMQLIQLYLYVYVFGIATVNKTQPWYIEKSLFALYF